MGTSSIALRAALARLAERQQGYFTARQARALGYADSVHGYHVRRGDWERRARGVYRLTACPLPRHAPLFDAWYWTRGRDDRPLGVYCGPTAKALRDGAAAIEAPWHMRVPAAFRRNSRPPFPLELIRDDRPIEVLWLGGLPACAEPPGPPLRPDRFLAALEAGED